jgi:hypothetical protein
MEPIMIIPTVGRIVWFTPSTNPPKGFAHSDKREPCAAIVTRVWGNREVSLAVFDSEGYVHPTLSVPLLQDDDPKPEGGFFCAWMPYQLGRAAKEAEETYVKVYGS